MTTPDQDESRRPLAHWGYRVVAFLINTIFLSVVFIISLLSATQIVVVLDRHLGDYLNIDESLEAWVTAVFTVAAWIMVFVLLIWGGLLEGKWGRTPGKAVMRLKVVSANDHNHTIGIARGIARIIIASSVLPLFLLSNMTITRVNATFYWIGLVFWLSDHLWPIWDNQHQTFHDKITGSHVISTRPS